MVLLGRNFGYFEDEAAFRNGNAAKGTLDITKETRVEREGDRILITCGVDTMPFKADQPGVTSDQWFELLQVSIFET
jgi:hypothetical protein